MMNSGWLNGTCSKYSSASCSVGGRKSSSIQLQIKERGHNMVAHVHLIYIYYNRPTWIYSLEFFHLHILDIILIINYFIHQSMVSQNISQLSLWAYGNFTFTLFGINGFKGNYCGFRIIFLCGGQYSWIANICRFMCIEDMWIGWGFIIH